MHKQLVAVLVIALLAITFAPVVSSEDEDTILLAQTLYALGRDESYETKLALGTVIANRIESFYFPNTLTKVIYEQHQFPVSTRFNEECLKAARAILNGQRSLVRDALYYKAVDSQYPWGEENRIGQVGGYYFYSQNGNPYKGI